MYCNGAIGWSAKNLKIVPDSSNEAEMAIGSRAAKEGIFVRGALRANGRPVSGPTATLTVHG